MVITEVRIKLMDVNHERLLGFCSITLDHMFVIRDLKIIEGTRGVFIAMPSRKLMDRCPECGFKNHLRARFCNHCGLALDEDRAVRPGDGKQKLHADIAHPIHGPCRDMIQKSVMRAYEEERQRAKLPGYVCRYDDLDIAELEEPLDFANFRLDSAHATTSAHSRQGSSVRSFGEGILDR